MLIRVRMIVPVLGLVLLGSVAACSDSPTGATVSGSRPPRANGLGFGSGNDQDPKTTESAPTATGQSEAAADSGSTAAGRNGLGFGSGN
jgi:hypothetical protein